MKQLRLIACHLVVTRGGKNKVYFVTLSSQIIQIFLEILSLLTSVRALLLPAKIILFWNYAKKHSITSLNSTIGLYNSFWIFFLLFSISFLMYANKVLAVMITDTNWANVFVELSMLMHRYGFCFSWADNSSLYPYQGAVQINPFYVHCFAFVSI